MRQYPTELHKSSYWQFLKNEHLFCSEPTGTETEVRYEIANACDPDTAHLAFFAFRPTSASERQKEVVR